ncbi:MAG: hypothetical protein ABIQ01_13390, partial [Pseudolysinimonas sp.]
MSDLDPLATIDLTGGPDETPVAKVGRVIGGVVLLILGGAFAIGSFAVYVAGAFIPGMGDWQELLGDGLLYAAIIGFVIAVTGFELVRRSRKSRKAAEAAEAAAVMTKLKAAGVYDGTSTPRTIAQAMDDTADGLGDLTGGTTGI